LNLDAGEMPEIMIDGSEERLFKLVTSVNIACGGHAGDAVSMAGAVVLAKKYNLRVGAHPSFPDRENFGRQALAIKHDDLVDSLTTQIQNLRAICVLKHAHLTHVKPHGALYNLCAYDKNLAAAVIESVLEFSEKFTVVGLAGSPFLKWCVEAGLPVMGEGFCDRGYEDDGTLRPRGEEGALITDPVECAVQAVRLAQSGQVQTLCIHGDGPNAEATAVAVRSALEKAGYKI